MWVLPNSVMSAGNKRFLALVLGFCAMLVSAMPVNAAEPERRAVVDSDRTPVASIPRDDPRVTINVHVYLQILDSPASGENIEPRSDQDRGFKMASPAASFAPAREWAITLDQSSDLWSSSSSPVPSSRLRRDDGSHDAGGTGLVSLFTMVDERLYLAFAGASHASPGFGASVVARPAATSHAPLPPIAVRLAADDLQPPAEQPSAWRRLPFTLGHSLSLRAAIGF